MNFNNYVGIASAHQVAGDDNAAADRQCQINQARASGLYKAVSAVKRVQLHN